MLLSDNYKRKKANNTDFPRFEGRVKFVLHNCKNHTDEYVFEKHNDPTNALRDIFAGNYGGLVDYDNFTDLFKTWLGGVLVFANPLDTTSEGWADDYGIPARTVNACVAHAGQTPIGEPPYDQGDDTTRGNPDNSGVITSVGSTKICFEWGTSAGNAPLISSLGLTHTDVGSYGCGVSSHAQKLLEPFANIGCKSRSYAYGNDGVTPLAINNNVAYSFYYDTATHIYIYKTPINSTKYKLQGGSLLPLTAYTQTVEATLTNCARQTAGDCYYHFDFANNLLHLFRVVSESVPTGSDKNLYWDKIDLDSGSVTHEEIQVEGALWKFHGTDSTWWNRNNLNLPTRAMILDNHLYLYAIDGQVSQYQIIPANNLYVVNLANTSDVTTVDMSDFNDNNLTFTANDYQGNWVHTAERFSTFGHIIAHDSFLVNGGAVFGCVNHNGPASPNSAHAYAHENLISSSEFGMNVSLNMVAVNKLYLATKWNLDEGVTKTSAMSMRVEYELTEI